MSQLYATQQDRPDTGQLLVNVSSMISSRAVSNATVQIMDSNEPEQVLEAGTSFGVQSEACVCPAILCI